MMKKPVLWVPTHIPSILRSSPEITGLLSLGFPSTEPVNKIQISWNSCEGYNYIKCPSKNRHSVSGDHLWTLSSILSFWLLTKE